MLNYDRVESYCIDDILNSKIWEGIPDVRGKSWKTTRKNIHKVQREIGSIDFCDCPAPSLIEKWITDWSGDKELYDPELIVKSLIQSEHRTGIGTDKGECVRILCWDYNHQYLNFRHCLVRQDILGLSDYARMLVRDRCGRKTLINDGGSVGNDKLYKYKLRLNPIIIHQIYGGLK